MERRQCTTRGLRTIERLQAWSILLYWPLEHITYLLGHDLIPAELSLAPSVNASKSRGAMIKLDAGKLTRASMGLWGLYLGLQLINLYNDNKQVNAQERLLNKSKVLLSTQRIRFYELLNAGHLYCDGACQTQPAQEDHCMRGYCPVVQCAPGSSLVRLPSSSSCSPLALRIHHFPYRDPNQTFLFIYMSSDLKAVS